MPSVLKPAALFISWGAGAMLLALGACEGSLEIGRTRVERTRAVAVSAADPAVPVGTDGADGDVAQAEDAVSDGDALGAIDGDRSTVELGEDAAVRDVGVESAAWPVIIEGDTRRSLRDAWDRYACAPEADESGPEEVHTVAIPRLGILRARLDDVSGDGVDVDVHLLAEAAPEACVKRDDKALAWVVRPGTWTLAVDSWVNGDGVPRAGPYRLELDFVPLDAGPCALVDRPQRMFWQDCAEGIDCSDDGTDRWLRTPSLGPVVGEAHLVTVDESFEGDGWPTSARDGLERHHALSQAATGLAMDRRSDWAPEGEGGSHWGGGATGVKLPVMDEAWYVNMYWRDRPARGRRMLVIEPWSGRAVVAAGGWETGPGSNTAIGGAVEEIHGVLGSQHRDELVMGFLVDEALPLGPITCW